MPITVQTAAQNSRCFGYPTVAFENDKWGPRTDSRCEILDLRRPVHCELPRYRAWGCRSEDGSYSVRILQDGRTALHWAAFSGSLDIMQFLLEQKAEVDKIDGSGWTALHIAGMYLSS